MLDIDLSDFERRARQLGGAVDQVPFALANAMTSAAFKTRSYLIEDTWPSHVNSLNRGFLRNALRVEPARKHNLVVSIVDTLGRASLKAHAFGGIKKAKKRFLAIPPRGSVKRTAHGVAKKDRPRYIIDHTPKRALRITARGIFVGKGGRLHLRYAFKRTARINQDVPFVRDFANVMRAEMRTQFPKALRRAMSTRR